MMNRKEVIVELAKKTGYTQKDISNVLDSLRELIIEQVSMFNTIKILDGIAFVGEYVGARTRRNPYSGEDIMCNPKVKLKAKFGKTIRHDVEKVSDLG